MPNQLNDGTYEIDTEASTVKWMGEKKIANKSHHGIVKIKSGEITIKDNKPVGGNIVIDMTTISPTDGTEDKLTKHLKSEDFFEVEAYPEAVYKIESSDFAKDDKYGINGEFTMKGETHELAIPARINQNGKNIHTTTTFMIDRSRWKVKYGSESFFKNLGDKVIKDEIELTLDLLAKPNT